MNKSIGFEWSNQVVHRRRQIPVLRPPGDLSVMILGVDGMLARASHSMDRCFYYVVRSDVVVAGQRKTGSLHRDPGTLHVKYR